ncbi:hypothetical protein J1605_005051 [Eschrichtius robustus]|uniref:Uncharacterized protein n=1 Tax=Eschrichtius robustus TaxID=9764 RepID=A0AB34HCT5_ESCRO|nr:hypothetical protein J1605_005051 [Eschrichtius robustus]
MQLATFEINPFCIMQRMPPLLGLATPHPSPETNHCRARACTSPPPPCRAARSYRAAPVAARRLLKGGSRPLKAPRARRTAAPFPAGARRARPSPRGAQARPGALPPSAPPPGAAFLFRRRLREPGGARCIVGAAESRSREEAEGAKRTERGRAGMAPLAAPLRLHRAAPHKEPGPGWPLKAAAGDLRCPRALLCAHRPPPRRVLPGGCAAPAPTSPRPPRCLFPRLGDLGGGGSVKKRAA